MATDRRWILSGSKDRTIRFWDIHTGECSLLLLGHRNTVIQMAASPFAKQFASVSGDRQLRIWSYGEVHEYLGSPGVVSGLAP
jgi:glucose repression regulatory protein TUP1